MGKDYDLVVAIDESDLNGLTPDEAKLIEGFMAVIEDKLTPYPEGGEVEINWEKEILTVTPVGGKAMEWTFKEMLKLMRESLH